MKKWVLLPLALLLLWSAAGENFADDHENNAPTRKNLQDAYKRLTNENACYLMFADRAEQDGYDRASSLLRAIACSEKVLSGRLARALQDLGETPQAASEPPAVNDTHKNLEAIYTNERYEQEMLFPSYVAQAKRELQARAYDQLQDVRVAESYHVLLCEKALENLETFRSPKQDYYVCPLCGRIYEELSDDPCRTCNTDSVSFIKVN